MSATVDLPEPDSPVNHSTAGFWCLRLARASLSIEVAWRWTLEARRSGWSIIPAAAVALVKRSIRMKLPVSGFSE